MSDEQEDLSPDAAEFRCLVPFPDESHSFVHGFEAGMVWQRMNAKERLIDNPIAYHKANREVLINMAAAQGYDILEDTDCDDTWIMMTFEKRARRFAVIDGAKPQ
jgi:hypothetical protein